MIAQNGLEAAISRSGAIAKAVNVYDGKLTNRNVADALGLEYTELQSLL